MTTTVAWISFQKTSPVALTFASDSRLTWPNGSAWDFGRKVFWCKKSPDIFGFAGDALLQSTVISQVCELFDYSIASISGGCGSERHDVFMSLLQSASRQLNGVKANELNVLHGMRDGEGGTARFRLWRTRYSAQGGRWSDQELTLQAEGKKNKLDDPGQFFCAGSGAGKLRDNWKARSLEAGETSRSIFRALIDVIEQKRDRFTGGPPQLVTLGRSGFAKPVGVIINEERSFCGLQLGGKGQGGTIEWRDEDFAFLNPTTLELKSNAPEHHFKQGK